MTVKAGKVAAGGPGRPLHVAAVRMLVAMAAGLDLRHATVISRNDKWSLDATTPTGRPIDPCQARTIVLDGGVDVRDRLLRLCGLVSEAMAAPRGTFGLGDTEPDKREAGFASFLAAKNWATGERTYPATSEAIVYGLSPAYADIFAAESPELVFLDRYRSCLHLTGQHGSSEYTFS